MSWRLTLSRSAVKELRALDPVVRKRIAASLESLTIDARPHGVRKLVGEAELWRLRVGDYRIVYSIDDQAHAVDVVAIRHRSRAYD